MSTATSASVGVATRKAGRGELDSLSQREAAADDLNRCYCETQECNESVEMEERYTPNDSSIPTLDETPVDSPIQLTNEDAPSGPSEPSVELDKYLEEEKQPRKDPNFNVLIWWQGVGLRYPTLRKIARDILAVPISTVASESVFSTGGSMPNHIVARLEDNHSLTTATAAFL
nr:zinc finger BED domain-containing protein DAYSLEEPER-like [Ipomoea batatas]